MTEALVIGRIGVDFTPTTPATSLAEAASFIRAVGGFAGNIGIGLARLGVATMVVSGVGDDGHGAYLRQALTDEGIDVGSVVTFTGSRTQVAFYEAWPPDRFPVTFYRVPPAPDTRLTIADLPDDILDRAPLVVLSAALFAGEPARATAMRVLERRVASRSRRSRSGTMLDLDWRPTLWADPNEYPELMAEAIHRADVVIGSDEEFEAAGLDPDAACSPERVIVLKHGPAGVSLITETGRRSLPGIAVDVVCGLGSGDALTAAFGGGLLRGLDPIVALERGNAAGAIVATRLTCSAMPTAAEIDEMLARRGIRPQGVLP
jgi:5-dehydro-2-deoxygluconokinase